MNNRIFNVPLSGIIPPLVTPLSDNNTLDMDGLQRLIERLIAGGVAGLFILGTTGEAQSLSYKLRVDMIVQTCRLAAGRLPVLVCISDTSIVESVSLAQVAADNGAAAVVSAPPYYYAPAQAELIEFYANLLKQLPLPLFLYNMPTHTKVNFAPATVRTIAENPGVIGFKDSSANTVYFQSVMSVMKDRPDFYLFVGPEEVMGECVLMGGHGGINGGANMFPELYVAVYNAARQGDLQRVHQLQQVIMQISNSVYSVGKHGSSYLKGLKSALHIMGVCNDFLAVPFHRFEKAEKDQVRDILTDLSRNTLLRDLSDFSILN